MLDFNEAWKYIGPKLKDTMAKIAMPFEVIPEEYPEEDGSSYSFVLDKCLVIATLVASQTDYLYSIDISIINKRECNLYVSYCPWEDTDKMFTDDLADLEERVNNVPVEEFISILKGIKESTTPNFPSRKKRMWAHPLLTLTELQKAEYVKKQLCPFCGSEKKKLNPVYTIEENHYRRVNCLGCGLEWVEVLRLAYEVIDVK